MTDHSTFIAYIQRDLWGLERGVLDRAVEVFSRQVNGIKLDADALAEIGAQRDAAGKSERRELEMVGSTAVIPITGVIAKFSSMVNGSSQPSGTAVERVDADLNAALKDPDVDRIMLRIDSPGGSIAGVADLSESVRRAGDHKPITAFIEDTGASAAYWIAAQASNIYANKSAAVGSIGVYAVVVDASKAAADKGLAFHVIKSGPQKGAGIIGTPISDDQLAAFQERIDDVFNLFVNDVASGRGMDRDKVLASADGRVFTGQRAKKLGLVDAITDFRGALKRTARATVADGPRRARAEIQEPTIMANEQDTAAEKAAALAAQEQKHKEEAKAAADAAVKADRKRTASIMAAIGDFPALAAEAIHESLSVNEAKALAFDVQGEYLTEAQNRLKAIVDAGVEPADVATDAEGGAGMPADKAKAGEDDGKAETYDAAFLAAKAGPGGPLIDSQAHKVAAAKFPKAFDAWNARNTENRPPETHKN